MTDNQRPTRILAIDDEEMILRALRRTLAHRGYEVFTLEDGTAAVDLARREDIDVVLCDIRMPAVNGLDVLRFVKSALPDVEVVMMTAYATVQTAIQAIRLGAYDYLTKPFDDVEQVVAVIERAAERRRLRQRNCVLETELARLGPRSLIGDSAAMRLVLRMVDAVASTDSNVLIQGESGTGKELVAREIHRRSKRSGGPWVAINCADLAGSVLESELFGYVKGAFTGAVADRKGLLQAASRGTLFLDEIEDMPPPVQSKLLRVLQEREVRPVGSTDVIAIDVRVVCASLRPLDKLIAEKKFREDLYYRINVVQIDVPPLRDRVDDIPLLSQFFLQRAAKKTGKPGLRIEPDAVEQLCRMAWPGNVRELENAIERAAVLCADETIRVPDLPQRQLDDRLRDQATDLPGLSFGDAKARAVKLFERSYAEALLQRTNGNLSEAARIAGLDRSNFKRIVTRNGVATTDFRSDE